MSGAGSLSTTEVEGLLIGLPAESREIVLALRSFIRETCPDLTESVLWGALSYHDPARGGRVKGAVCGIEFVRGPVQLSFLHGARLPDPEHLLQGDRLSKRFLEIASVASVPWRDIRCLVEQAAMLDPSTFDLIEPRPQR